jgi:hypothetical protein
MRDSQIINKLIDLLKQAFSLKSEPDLICAQSRRSAEAILKIIYKNEYEQVPPQIAFEGLLRGIQKKGIFPSHIVPLFETIQRLGNKTMHIDENLTSRTINDAAIVESNLGGITNWFFNEYLNIEIDENIFNKTTSNTNTDSKTNYEEIIKSALSDLILELDEYEQILDARNNLGLSEEVAQEIEKKICKETLNKNVNNISEILSNTDLESFKKLDVLRDNRPDWVNRSILNSNSSAPFILKNYLSYYFQEIEIEIIIDTEPLLSILGCWQGWYFQGNSKTYYNLLFLAKGENEFIGLSVEPINPEWHNKIDEGSYLLAWIEGALVDEIVFTYCKTYILENTWSIDYEGVIIENCQHFEGEWRTGNYSGSFNAMRTKSLLPIRIFDTYTQKPIVTSTYLSKLLDLTSSWYIHLAGKSSSVGMLHIIEVKGNLYANLITNENNQIHLIYLEGEYIEFAKATMVEKNTVIGSSYNLMIMFTIDWNNFLLNGTIKDDFYKIRALKGFKL